MSYEGELLFPFHAPACGLCKDIHPYLETFCKSCIQSLCNNCTKLHQTDSKYKDHLVVERSYPVLRLYGPARIAEPCRVHPTKEISAYCKDCWIPCCISCLVERHQTHKFSTIEDVYLSAERNLNDYTKKASAEMKLKEELTAKSVYTFLSTKNRIKRIVEKDVYSFQRSMNQMIDNSCDRLLKHIDNTDTDLQKLKGELCEQKKKLGMLIIDVESVIVKGGLSLVAYTPPSLSNFKIKSALSTFKIPYFLPNNHLIRQIESSIGVIEFNGQIEISKVSSFECNKGVNSINAVSNDSAWLCIFESETLSLYKNYGALIELVPIIVSKDLNDTVTKRSGEMIITSKDGRIVSMSKGGLIKTLVVTAPFFPEGVCLTENEEVVVCMRGQNERNHVAVLAPGGQKKLHEINKHITDPYRVVCNLKYLCVVNAGSNVVCFENFNRVSWVYDGSHANLNESFYPRGISVDKFHNLLIIDYNNDCVHYIDREGGLIQVILTKEQTGLVSPCAISLDDSKNQVWLGDGSGEVVICTYLK